MGKEDLALTSKRKLYHSMQLIKIVLGSVVFVLSITVLQLNHLDFYVPYLSGAMAFSGILALFIQRKFDTKLKWGPLFITNFDFIAFLYSIYIAKFFYNTLFFWMAGVVTLTYFFTKAKWAIVQAVITISVLLWWGHTGFHTYLDIVTDDTYIRSFTLSSLVNLIFVFTIFHVNQKIKNAYYQKLEKTTLDLEDVTSLPLCNPNPLFVYSSQQELSPKNKVAREFVLFSSNEELEDLILFAKKVLANKQSDSLIIKLNEFEFMVNAVFVKDKVNLYLTDITELMETRRVFQEKEQYNRAIIDAMPGFVSWIDRERQYLGVNDHMCEFFNKKQEDFIGQPIGEVSQGDQIIVDLVEDLFENDKDLLQKEFSFNYKEKEYWSYVTLKQYNNGNNAVLVSTDITKLKEAEKQVREEQAKAESNAKLAAFGEMAAGIAHEINNPLAILNGIGHRLQKLKEKDKLSDEKFYDLLNKLFYGVERISKIIMGMKNLARDGADDDFEFAKVQDILDDSLVLLSKKCRHKNIELKVAQIPEDSGMICQRVQISQVLVILINNSIDAIEQLNEKWIEIGYQDNDNFAFISVSDSGAGIPESVARKIFEPFYTTKGVGKGTGLGLSLASKIVKAHGGTFSLDRESKNTKFIIQIPKKKSIKSAA